MGSGPTGNIHRAAPERNRQPSFQSSEPPVPTEGATLAAPENAKVRNGLSLDRLLRHVQLESFIVSNTPAHTMKMLWGMDKPAMKARHILFQKEDKDSYVKTMLESATADRPSVAS